MKYLHLIFIALLATSLSACQDSKPVKTTAPAAKATAEQPMTSPEMTQQMSGTVLETMNTAGYTYVKVKTADKDIWAAAPEFNVAVGDSVIIPEGMVMPNYHSNTLNRDFDELYFVSNILAPNASMALNTQCAEAGHTDMAANAMEQHTKPAISTIEVDFSGLTKAQNGYTIAEVFTQQADLATQEISIRAKVVKFSPNIMKTNWIHLQDGTGAAGSNDLTITTSGQAAMGDTVLVKGILDLNQDFGYGYKYDVIIQDAQITVE
ncbi:MAG: hypothetical protein U9R29_10470 [Thermodesulfobacteriota bacterium]|nr:hypothetical protein [Thermodesulfobacteriota bacterium]